MKKRLCACLAIVLALVSLTACGSSLEVSRNTIYVQKKGNIIGASVVDNFSKDYYDAEELENYVKERVDAYAAEHGSKSAKVDKFSVEENVAKLYIKYAGYEDYAALNGVTLFAGTVPQAMAAGYDFEEEFLAVEDGKLGRAADKDEVTSGSEYKVVILSEKVDVKVDGSILYASADYTSLAASDTVSVTLPEDASDAAQTSLTYIIYK